MVSRVAPAKSDLPFGKRDQAMIGDGYAMGVAAQILEHNGSWKFALMILNQ